VSSLKTPVGPERKSVYLRRRLFVLAGLLAIVAFVVLVILKPGSSGSAASAPEVVLPAEVVVGEKVEEPTGELPGCPPGQLEVTPVVNLDSYATNELPQLSMRIENTGETACHAELGTAGMSFKITSGSDEVWRSTDCQVKPDSRMIILEPATPLETEPLEWDRTRSSTETCEIARDQVGADGATYHLHAAAAGVQSGSTATFLLY
jgi:hypothetical protein